MQWFALQQGHKSCARQSLSDLDLARCCLRETRRAAAISRRSRPIATVKASQSVNRRIVTQTADILRFSSLQALENISSGSEISCLYHFQGAMLFFHSCRLRQTQHLIAEFWNAVITPAAFCFLRGQA